VEKSNQQRNGEYGMSEIAKTLAQELGIDRDALRERYQLERNKRIRPEHRNQYAEVKDALTMLNQDPYAPVAVKRDARHEEADVVIIGGGFGGLLAAVRLRQAGVSDIRIIESGSDFGGTWYWNRYPGAQCDIESYCYFPMLEELGYMPKERYAYAPEIFDYGRQIAKRFDLYETALFQTNVTGQVWLEGDARWAVATDRGDTLKARFVVHAVGGLNKPKLPGVTGVETFTGKIFHTCRWDYAYTGGDHSGKMQGLADKRVAVVGTGCTAIQCVPYVARDAKHLTVFQRTPASVDQRGNAPTDKAWADALQPGWQEARRRNFDDTFANQPVEEILVTDGWTYQQRKLFKLLTTKIDPETLAEADYVELMELVDLQYNEEMRARVDTLVKDPETRDKLKAWYRQFCKRPTFNDDYLPTFNRDNVTLVDTGATKGIESITANGVVVDGAEYEVDCIIFATGFELGTAYTNRAGFDPVGKQDVSLSAYWSDYVKTLHGMQTRGFPNQFIMAVGVQGAFGVNITAILEDQAKHVAWLVRVAQEKNIRTMEPTAAAEGEWVALCTPDFEDPANAVEVAFHMSCTPSYYNNEGYLTDPTIPMSYPYGVNAFNAHMTAWRDAGDLAGLELELA